MVKSFLNASVGGRRAEEVKRRRRDGWNGVGAQRRRRAADGSPPLLRPNSIPARDERAVCGVERASSRGIRGDGQPVERSKPRVGHGGQTDLTELHCDGLLKFKSGSDELSHLTTIVSQLVITLAVGQVKFFHADKFELKLFDLLQSERGESGLRFAAEHLADEEREGAAVGKHGLVHDLDC